MHIHYKQEVIHYEHTLYITVLQFLLYMEICSYMYRQVAALQIKFMTLQGT